MTIKELNVSTGQTIERDPTATELAVMPNTIASPIPQGDAFTQAIKTGLGGIVAANAIAKNEPLLEAALREQNWPDVTALVKDALANAVITQAQYDAIKAAAAAYNIPVTL